MHTKISMKNLQTFGHQNPFLRQRSVSSKSRNQTQSFTFHSSTSTFKEKNKLKNEQKAFKDITNKKQNRPSSTYRQYLSPKVSKQNPVSFSFHPEQVSRKPYLQGQYKNYSCEGIIHLLKNQEQSLERVKHVVQTDKQKINRNFSEFKQTINNIIDDLKLTICCHVDEQYQQFVKNFRIVKVQYINYCNIKKQFWQVRQGHIEKTQKNADKYHQIGGGSKVLQFPGMISNNKQTINNEMLLMSVIQDIKDCKKHINYKQFSQIQQKLLNPLLNTTKNMIRQMGIQSYYKPQIAHNTFKILQASFQDKLHQMYDKMDLFITDHRRQRDDQAIIKKQNFNNSPIQRINHHEKPDVNQLQEDMNMNKKKKSVKQGQIYIRKRNSSPDDMGQQIHTHSFGMITRTKDKFGQNEKEKQKYLSTANTMTNTCGQSQNQYKSNNKFQTNNGQNIQVQYKIAFNNHKTRKNKHYRHSLQANEQNHPSNCKLQEYRTIIDKSFSPNSDKPSQKSQTALCVINLQNRAKIVVGTKNGIVKIFCTKTGAKLNQLYGHKASICSLSTLTQGSIINQNQLIVSGGDIGCCQAILWNLRDNKVYHNFSQHHQAAITCLIDMQDGRHFASGSFDCSLNIFNYKKKQLTKSTNTGQKITTLISINSNGHKYLITGNLNSQVCVWKVCRNTFDNISGVQSIRAINIGTYPYSFAVMNSNQIIVGGKDNWIRVVNIWKGIVKNAAQIGQCQQIISLDGAYIGCCKNGGLTLIQTKQNELKCQRIVGKGGVLSFSCGICPRYALQLNQQKGQGNMQGFLYMPNHHNPTHSQIRVWKISKNERLRQRYKNLNGNTY